VKLTALTYNKPAIMNNKEKTDQPATLFLNCSYRKDFEFLYDIFSANIYEAIHSIVETEEIAEKILIKTFVAIRKEQFAYSKNYMGIFTLLLSIAIRFSYDELTDSHPKKWVYQKLEENMGLVGKPIYS
jgi:hypothetical protein